MTTAEDVGRALMEIHDAKKELDEVLANLNSVQRRSSRAATEASLAMVIPLLHDAKQQTKRARNQLTREQMRLKTRYAELRLAEHASKY